MKKITFLSAMLLFSIVGFSQFNETFESALPAGFTVVNNGSTNGWVFLDNPTGGAHGGTGVASITYDASVAHDDYLITSQISVTAGVSDQLSFWIKSRSGTFLEPYEVLLSTTDTAPGSFTTTLQASEDAAATWEEKIFDLTTYVGQNIYIAIRATGTNEWQLFVDDMVNSAIPACPNVMNLAAGNFTSPDSADITWDAVTGATMYNWEVQPQGVAQGTAGEIASGSVAGTTATTSGLVGGTTYTVYVQSDCGGAAGVYQSFDFTFILPPANDECANAIALTVNSDFACATVTAGTTVGATASSQADDVTGTPNTDVWFSFVATGTNHRVTLTNVVNQGGGTSTSTDMGMGVYDATGGCAGLVFSADSDPNTLDLTGLTPATTYYVRVYGWLTTIQYNNFDICVGTPPAAPANDNLCNAISLTIDTAAVAGSYTNDSATEEANEPAGACYSGGAQGTVWFSFVAPASGEVQVSTDFGGTMTDSEIAVYDATGVTCSDLSTLSAAVGCDQDSGTVVTYNSILNLNAANGNALTPGNTYYIQVSGYNNNRGTFGIQVFDQVTLSVDNFDIDENFNYYPNPVQDKLVVSAKNQIEVLSIINMLGQTVKTVTPNINNYELDFSDLKSGVYFVKATINGIDGTFRIIKK
ncbi:choice-of-anchor J domain-containing protein [Pseudofulvibacter geojedonensis]|uniref:Choice-of-anchor J domain-containing protein n=1 Tax=Pseudofulvibacter geojedonensis TaxID=1123758 RepID=A0ABW3HZ39_9FLAO